MISRTIFRNISLLLILLILSCSSDSIKEPIQLQEVKDAGVITIGNSVLEITFDEALEERNSSILLQLIGKDQSNINLDSKEKEFSHSLSKNIEEVKTNLEIPVDDYYGYLTFYSTRRRFLRPNFRSKAKMFFGLDIPYEYRERITKENRCIRKAGREDIETYYYCPKLIVHDTNSKKIRISLNEETDLDLYRSSLVYLVGFSLASSTAVPILAIAPPAYFGLIHYTNRVDIEVSK